MKAPPRQSFRLSLHLVVPLFLLLSAAIVSTESCTTSPSQEGTAQEQSSQEQPNLTDTQEVGGSSEPQTQPEPKAEPQPEPKTEPKAEPQAEPKVESTADADAGTTETRASEGLTDSVGEKTENGEPGVCTGIEPPYPDFVVSLPPDNELPENYTPEDKCKYKPGQCPGTAAPNWKLEDFQPKSCGYKKEYGLSAFKGRVTVVALLAAW